ncbi:hypothetical protein BV898_08133 [Hypsibius exemplaris]|uniref:Uncharacterized protein n=1 Tax=Hypsibius exemplaris TaxID=2072580 RepID=A0A1W0WRR6_HYPEX|nr:hypothetical protein BV898_08133 [Hypsibius exemplaris]
MDDWHPKRVLEFRAEWQNTGRVNDKMGTFIQRICNCLRSVHARVKQLEKSFCNDFEQTFTCVTSEPDEPRRTPAKPKNPANSNGLRRTLANPGETEEPSQLQRTPTNPGEPSKPWRTPAYPSELGEPSEPRRTSANPANLANPENSNKLRQTLANSANSANPGEPSELD